VTNLSGFQVTGNAAENYQRFNGIIMAPFIEGVLSAAEIREGSRVLDVACGTGLSTRRAAEVAGASGRIVGLDINAGMLAVARASEVPLEASIEWREGSALDLPFDDERFSAVICQQGIQFFPDLGRATAEMAHVTARGGCIAVSFWAALDQQTYMRAQAERLRAVLGDAVAPLAPAFALSPDAVRAAFTSAGLREVTATLITRTISLPSLDPYAAQQVSTLPVASAFGALSDEQRHAYIEGMAQDLSAHRTAEGNYDCPIASWVVKAKK
jgi:ubiquinone/menaquinone biosynthesis C-methylase UbiE